MFLQKKKDVFELAWDKNISYAKLHKNQEQEFSAYNFEGVDASSTIGLFDVYEKEAKRLLVLGFLFPAYEYMLKTSHLFNLLDASGTISVTERASYIARVRELAKSCARTYIERLENF
jgi:glycyl-tRNA synthetase alpha chain